MSYTPEYLKAKVAAAWRIIQAATAAETISLAAKAATIGLVTELGRFVEVLFKTDDIGLTDAQKQAFYKVSTDAYGALDKYVAALSKPREDASTVGDQEYARVVKALRDVSALLDSYKLSIHKSLYDQVTGLEDYVYVFAKKAPENFVAPTDRIDTKGTTKPRFDAYSVADDDTVQFTKDRQDGSAFTDYRYGFIEKVLTDRVNVTDDIDGLASIDDDQEVQFFKVVGELTATQDEFYRFMAFVRAFSDEAVFSDTSYNRLDKPFAELVTGVEDHAYVLSRKTPDSPSEFTDAAAYSASKPVSDVSVVSDDDTVQFTKDRQDTAGFVDTNAKDTIKVVSDTGRANDKAAVLVQKVLADTFNAADFLDYITIVVKRDFADLGAILDTSKLTVNKPLANQQYFVSDFGIKNVNKSAAELAFLSEILYRNTNKPLADTSRVSELKAISAVKPTNDGFSLTDSGSLRSQGYCDFTYMAEDYVGETRTF